MDELEIIPIGPPVGPPTIKEVAKIKSSYASTNKITIESFTNDYITDKEKNFIISSQNSWVHYKTIEKYLINVPMNTLYSWSGRGKEELRIPTQGQHSTREYFIDIRLVLKINSWKRIKRYKNQPIKEVKDDEDLPDKIIDETLRQMKLVIKKARLELLELVENLTQYMVSDMLNKE